MERQEESLLLPGTVLKGKYRIERVLGRGGMGEVVEALHVDLDRRVAIKVLHRDLRTQPDIVERFLREGRAASRMLNEHVARVLDVDRLDDGTPFLVMEYLDGSDLSVVRRKGVTLPVADVIDYVLQACEAISEAHGRGIIHRDLKPANLFLARLDDGTTRVKVLDFGISKLSGPVGGSEPSMTKTSVVMGSAEYMSPEQMLSTRDVDARTDIWALGVVLFELLTGRVPFEGDTLTQVCAMVMSQPPPKPRVLRADIPQALQATILQCLEKDQNRRFSSAKDLARKLLEDLKDLRNGAATALGLGAHAPADPPEGDAPTRVSAFPIVAAHPVVAVSALPNGPTLQSRTENPTAILPSAILPSNAISPSFIGSTHLGLSADPGAPVPKTGSRGLIVAAGAVLTLIALTLGWNLLGARDGAAAKSPMTFASGASVAREPMATEETEAFSAVAAVPSAAPIAAAARSGVEVASATPSATSAGPTRPVTPPSGLAIPTKPAVKPTNPAAKVKPNGID